MRSLRRRVQRRGDPTSRNLPWGDNASVHSLSPRSDKLATFDLRELDSGGSALKATQCSGPVRGWIQPLLCISLLALLLLPLSLSCDSERPHKELQEEYKLVVETDINNANENIANLLQNSSCPALKHKLHNCTADIREFVSSLHLLTCKMKKLRISHTDGLVRSVLNSLRCPCLEKPTKEPTVRLKKRTATRHRRNQRKTRRDRKKLCRSKAILFAMTRCYQILNSMLMAS